MVGKFPKAASVLLLAVIIPLCLRYLRSHYLLNWEGRYEFRPTKIHQPSSVEQIASILRGASLKGKTVTIVGSRHSWSDIAVPDDTMLSLEKYTGVVHIDKDRQLVTVRGGTTLEEIVIAIEADGLALPQLPSVSGQTIAGAIATGTHGTGIKYGNLATLVTAIEIVSGEGIVYRASENKNHDIFRTALIGLGAVGVITEVTITCVPAFNLHEVITLMPLQQCLQQLDDIVTSSDHVKLWLEFHTQQVQVYRSNKTTSPRRDSPTGFIFNLKFYVFEYASYVMSWIPRLTGAVMWVSVNIFKCLRTGDSVGSPLEVFNIPHYFVRHPELEYGVPYNATADLIRELIAIKEDMKNEISFNQITEIRFVKGDDIWLSPAYGRDTTFITVLTYNPSDVLMHRFFKRFASSAIQHGGRPHWGKLFYETEAELRTRYLKWDEFMAVREKMDPHRVFSNSFLRRLFHLSVKQ